MDLSSDNVTESEIEQIDLSQDIARIKSALQDDKEWSDEEYDYDTDGAGTDISISIATEPDTGDREHGEEKGTWVLACTVAYYIYCLIACFWTSFKKV